MDQVDESEMPEFHRLVNFPDHATRSRPTLRSPPPPGYKCCVMCGQSRLCPANYRDGVGGSSPDPKGPSPGKGGRTGNEDDNDGEGGAASSTSSAAHIIPRQNKGVCTACDVAVWCYVETDLDIKWCKGCKNFRPWPLFGEKMMATKCKRCRERQKDKYQQKLAATTTANIRSRARQQQLLQELQGQTTPQPQSQPPAPSTLGSL